MNLAINPAKCKITLNKKGNRSFPKMSFPVLTGIYSEIETAHHIFHFNLNGQIIRLKAKSKDWTHPHEWLRRSMGNDWVYYSTGGYTGVFEATGEYYLPNFTYPSNSILGGNPFKSVTVSNLINNWYSILKSEVEGHHFTRANSALIDSILRCTPAHLTKKANEFHRITGGKISVLPPDARHVGYNVIPLMISKGCLYKCRFCKVKNKDPFQELSHSAIDEQINQLKALYGPDLPNYNALYLGEHDALQTKPASIIYAIEKSYERLNLCDSYIDDFACFLFASATSITDAPEELFAKLQSLPGKSYINVGLESPDQKTLDQLGKPISSNLVWAAFHRIQNINKTYSNIEVTINLLMDSSLPEGHYRKAEELLRDTQTYQQNKGTVYFSPLRFDQPSRKLFFEFNRLKLMSRFPTYLYIIQRL